MGGVNWVVIIIKKRKTMARKNVCKKGENGAREHDLEKKEDATGRVWQTCKKCGACPMGVSKEIVYA